MLLFLLSILSVTWQEEPEVRRDADPITLLQEV